VTDPLELPFDQYQRYRLVADLLGPLRGRRKHLSILDVGGRTALLRAFLPDDRVTLVDVEPSGEARLVLGDGSALPFADASFDAVCAFDTLEHVPPRTRKAFVAECRRVARSWVLIAGPYRAPEVDEAEVLLQRFLREKLKVEHRYLEEHRTNTLPARDAVEKQLAAAGARVQSYGHANVRRWLALMALSMYLDHTPDLRGLARQVYRYYNREMYAGDRAEPVYRHVVVAALEGAALPERADPEPAPAGADGRPLVELAFDLIGFDRARGAWEEQNRRLWSVNETLRSDLEGHKQGLADERGAASRLREQIARHARETLAIEQAAKAREVEEAKARAELEHELASHRREVAQLGARLADGEAARAAALATVEDLRTQLAGLADRAAGQAELIADLRLALARHAEEALAIERAAKAREVEEAKARAELEHELASHRREVAQLAARLAAGEEARAAALATVEDLRGQLAGLADRAAGQAELIADLRLELARHAEETRAIEAAGAVRTLEEAKARAELERELASHRLELAHVMDALERERAAATEALAREADLRQGLEERLAGLGAELERERAAHDATRRALEGERVRAAEHEREARERGQVIGTLEADLAGHRGALAALRAEGERAAHEHARLAAELERLNGVLAEQNERAAAMRAELRSRVAGLKRAFGPKWSG
jgi:SAM-dependent methyltransferase